MKDTQVTQQERAAIFDMRDYANKILAGPPKLLDIKCRICTRNIGQTTNVLHTLDLCYSCREKWIAEMRREQNVLSGKRAVELVTDAMAKEPRHAY